MKRIAAIITVVLCILATFGITYLGTSAVKDQEIDENRSQYLAQIFDLQDEVIDLQSEKNRLNSSLSSWESKAERYKNILNTLVTIDKLEENLDEYIDNNVTVKGIFAGDVQGINYTSNVTDGTGKITIKNIYYGFEDNPALPIITSGKEYYWTGIFRYDKNLYPLDNPSYGTYKYIEFSSLKYIS